MKFTRISIQRWKELNIQPLDINKSVGGQALRNLPFHAEIQPGLDGF